MCEIAGVSRAAYYKWLQRTLTKRDIENEEIVKTLNLLYEQVKSIYGYRRMTLAINRQRKDSNRNAINESVSTD